MKIAMIEACRPRDSGSIGAHYIVTHAEKAGYKVDIAMKPRAGYDIELISVHHCTDFPRLAQMKKKAKIRIVGGHPMQNNPLPVIPFTDVVCIGEGETWIKRALGLLEHNLNASVLTDLPGTIVSERWRRGNCVPKMNVERPLPDNAPYLNRAGTRSAAWYLEIARGCPYKCAFCELGHSSPFRIYPEAMIHDMLEIADISKTRKINFYAPDEVSHPRYHELFDHLMQRGYSAGFSSMRIESILGRGIPPQMKKNHLLRVGIDGLSEKTRKRVGKAITNDMIIEYFKMLTARGNVRFKMFFIFGYPWEELSDFNDFANLMDRLRRIELKKNISVRIKWTPFIPQPCTPLGNCDPVYDFKMVDKIMVWHALNDKPRYRNRPSMFFEADAKGPMGFNSHRRQVELTRGDEGVLFSKISPIYPLHEEIL